MGAKLKYSDVQNDVLGIGKFTNSPNITFSNGASAPVYSANAGSMYLETTTNSVYLRSVISSVTSWMKISSGISNVESGHYSSNLSTTLTFGTGNEAPIAGDLVGIYGAGSWSASGVLPATRTFGAGAGSANAGVHVAGSASGVRKTNTYLFDGAVWTTSGNISQTNFFLSACGSQNATLIVGGNNTSTQSITELFNGTTWANSANLTQSKERAAGFGEQNSGLIVGGTDNVVDFSNTQLFNGYTWATSGNLSQSKDLLSGTGSQNAGAIAGGQADALDVSMVELFNGSTWIVSGNLSITIRRQLAFTGSQNSGLISTGISGIAALRTTELFNGSTWSSSGLLSMSRYNASGGGSQNSSFAVGGSDQAGDPLDITELHSQSTYRKVSTSNIKTAKNIGVAMVVTPGSGIVLHQGYNSSVTYPVNSYLVTNKYLLSTNTSATDFSSGFAIAAVSGTAPAMLITLTSPFLNQVVSGNIIFVAGATAGNNGVFTIDKVEFGSQLSINNASGVAQGATGTVKICNTLLIKSIPGPQDIVVGKTDSSGFLTISQPITVSSILSRLR